MTGDIKYTVFKTRPGYFGFCCTEKGVLRTCLPLKTKESVEDYLLAGIVNPVFDKNLLPSLQTQVIVYYEGHCIDFSKTPVDLSGLTPFTQKVLRACMKIRYGNKITYKHLAEQVGSPNSARAIGGVMARNPIPLIIPCHRVLSTNGSLCGFSAHGGLDTKKWMLSLESNTP
ncbi:MAG: methylated-DNA--[protein]-cysteine S-methyltransferase [Sedimentisphaerales bacterium]|nr:methylated-DNA--[protein]-cysteine S-methyltransferase [Sedimentisphaerales bacterium]